MRAMTMNAGEMKSTGSMRRLNCNQRYREEGDESKELLVSMQGM